MKDMLDNQELAPQNISGTVIINVAIVEDDADFRMGLEKVIVAEPQFSLVASYSSAEAFLSAFDSIAVDVVIMDINLPRMNGPECIALAKNKKSEVQYMMCTIYDDEEKLFESLKAGATGYLLKKTPPATIVSAVVDVKNGGSPMSAAIARKVVNTFHKDYQKPIGSPVLSQRENEILQLLSNGYRYKEIADKLFISIDTVRSHIRNIYEKLQVTSRIEAVNKVKGI